MTTVPPQFITTDTVTPPQEWARRTAAILDVSQQSPSTHTPFPPSGVGSLAVHPQVGDFSISAANEAQMGPFDAQLVSVMKTEDGEAAASPSAEVPGAFPETPRDEQSGTHQAAGITSFFMRKYLYSRRSFARSPHPQRRSQTVRPSTTSLIHGR